MVDIARDPRWGRIAEGSGEDPYLGSLMAAARVRGFQQNIFATVKHFAGYGAAEAGREYNETEISERTMREVYLPPFKAAVDAGVASIMSAFNDISGVPASGNAWLTDTVLRRERSEEHTSELQSQSNLVCRLLLEKKKKNRATAHA